MPVEVRVEFCQQSSVVSTVSSKEQSLGSPGRRVNAERRSWLVLFLRDTWALGKFPPEEGQEGTNPSLPGLALRACVCHNRQTSI